MPFPTILKLICRTQEMYNLNFELFSSFLVFFGLLQLNSSTLLSIQSTLQQQFHSSAFGIEKETFLYRSETVKRTMF